MSFNPTRRLARRSRKHTIKQAMRGAPRWRLPGRAKSASQARHVLLGGVRYTQVKR